MLNSEVLSTIENYFNECDLHLASLSNLEFEDAMYEMDIDFGSGASKGVFTNILDNEVVKIPFAYNEGDKMINYCDLEFEIYEKAARAGLSQYFASLRIVGSIEDVTVYAQEFCETYNVNYKLITAEDYPSNILADVNNDKVLNIRDVTTMQIELAKGESTEFLSQNCDVNADCKFDVNDVTYLQKYLAKVYDSFPY